MRWIFIIVIFIFWFKIKIYFITERDYVDQCGPPFLWPGPHPPVPPCHGVPPPHPLQPPPGTHPHPPTPPQPPRTSAPATPRCAWSESAPSARCTAAGGRGWSGSCLAAVGPSHCSPDSQGEVIHHCPWPVFLQPSQADRRHLQVHLPSSLCYLQPGLLALLPAGQG